MLNEFWRKAASPIVTPGGCEWIRPILTSPHLTHCYLNPHDSVPQTASRSVQPFCRAHERNRQTNRHRQTTLLPCCWICLLQLLRFTISAGGSTRSAAEHISGVQLMTICAVVKFKCAVENGNLCSFVLRCLNEMSIHKIITILHSLQFWTYIIDLSASGVSSPDPLIRGIVPGPHWELHPHTPLLFAECAVLNFSYSVPSCNTASVVCAGDESIGDVTQ